MSENKHEALEIANKLTSERESESQTIKYSTACAAVGILRRQHARIEELERALYKIADTKIRHYVLPSLELRHKEDIAVRALLTKKD